MVKIKRKQPAKQTKWTKQTRMLLCGATAAVLISGAILCLSLAGRQSLVVIGFIGDSITYGEGLDAAHMTAPAVQTSLLGKNFLAVNHSVSGAASDDWADVLLEPSIESFRSADVGVVQIMLGTNDASIRKNHVEVETFEENMQNIISRLQQAGFEKIILQRPPYFIVPTDNRDEVSLHLMDDYYLVLLGLVDGDTVFLGDCYAWDWFKNNPDRIPDATHPDAYGYKQLGRLWGEAYNRVVTDPPATQHRFTDGEKYYVNSEKSLVYSVEKEYLWFQSGFFAGVLVDGVILDKTLYHSFGGISTVITLNESYLNLLPEGEHTLTVRFTDGVSFSSSFLVLPESNTTDYIYIYAVGLPALTVFGLCAVLLFRRHRHHEK